MEISILNISRSSQLKTALTSEKLTENTVQNERAITWLDKEKVCFLVKTKINVNDEWVAVGDSEIEEFKNTVESLKLLKSSVPEPFLTAVLSVWEAPTVTKRLNELEVSENDQPKKLSD
jgi:hypothetical protein